jgi:HK97 family phage major capsid protein
MNDLIHSINDLSDSFQDFKEKQETRFNRLEKKTMHYKRWESLNKGSCENTEAFQAFQSYIRKGDDTDLINLTQKSLSSTVGEEGGYFIPQILQTRLEQQVEEWSPMRRLSNLIQISSSALELLMDRTGPDAGWVQETDARNETKAPTLYKVKIPVHELYAKPRVTEKLLSDSLTSVEDWLAQVVAKKLAQMENHAFIHGDGQNKPKGFLSYEVTTKDAWQWGKLEGITSGADGAFEEGAKGVDTLLDLMASLKPVYLKNAVWFMSRSAFVAAQKLKDADGRYILHPGTSQDQRPMIFGYPVEISEDMPALTSGQASKSVAFGNFKEAYQIVEHQGTQMLRDPYSTKPFVEFYTVKRIGGDVINFEALKILSFKA